MVRVVGSTPSDDSCYAKGVSAAYCGMIDDHLIMAGGSNFPYHPAEEGGAKKYYDAIYAASINRLGEVKNGRTCSLRWTQVAVLPEPMAYGVALTDSMGMIFVGGCNAQGGLDICFRMARKGTTLSIYPLPPLPCPIDNMGGCLLNDRVYVVGGMADGKPSTAMYALDFDYDEWFECASLPGQPRVEPICASQSGKLFVWGGYVQPLDSAGYVLREECMVHTDGYCYDPSADKWSPVASPMDADGHILTLTGSTAISWGEGEILVIGGAHKNVLLGGLRGDFPMPGYMQHEDEWYRLNRNILIYNVNSNSWRIATESDLSARTEAGLVALRSKRSSAVLLGGEYRPGVCSTEATLINLTNP